MRVLAITAMLTCGTNYAIVEPAADPKNEVESKPSEEEILAQHRKAVHEYLRVKFDDFEEYPNGYISLFSYAYVYDDSDEIVPVAVPEMQKFAPGTRFYRTELMHPDCFGFMGIPLLISVRAKGETLEIRTALPITSDEGVRKFVKQFELIPFDSEKQIKEFTYAVAKVFVVFLNEHQSKVKYEVRDVVQRMWECEAAIWKSYESSDGEMKEEVLKYVNVFHSEDEERGTYSDVVLNDKSILLQE